MGRTGRTDEEGRRVGVVEAESGDVPFDREPLSESIEERGGRLVAGPASDLQGLSPSVVVALDETALSAVARAGVDAPVLAVETDGVPSTPSERLPGVVQAALEGDCRAVRRSVLRVESEAVSERAFFDVGLLTEEPARISEYSVATGGEELDRFRADGVVVATPQGSHGYASAAGAPVLSPDVAAVAVVPIAPFVTRTKQWVLPHDRLAIAVERDEGAVSLQIDDRVVATVGVGSPVSIGADGDLTMLVGPDSG